MKSYPNLAKLDHMVMNSSDTLRSSSVHVDTKLGRACLSATGAPDTYGTSSTCETPGNK